MDSKTAQVKPEKAEKERKKISNKKTSAMNRKQLKMLPINLII